MNLRKTILAEHSKNQTMKIVRWVGHDKQRFEALMRLFLYDEYRVIQRAAWAVTYCVEAYPDLAKPWIGKMITNLEKQDLHPAVPRNTFRFFQNYDVPEKYLGALVNCAYRYLLSSDSPVAIRVFAMSTIANIVRREPELARELKVVVEELVKEGKPGMKSRGRKVIKMLEKMN